jgi:hypothetical protein
MFAGLGKSIPSAWLTDASGIPLKALYDADGDSVGEAFPAVWGDWLFDAAPAPSGTVPLFVYHARFHNRSL